jgi:hypothetical protein
MNKAFNQSVHLMAISVPDDFHDEYSAGSIGTL